MMKRLYLIRHAKSSWKDHTLDDCERPLNKRGKRDAPFMGQRLNSYQVRPDLILSSPAKRALKTAKMIAEKLEYPKDRIATDGSIYEAGISSLLNVIHCIDDANHHVFLFGHNPGLTMLAEYFTNRPIGNMPTCSIVCIDFDVTSWEKINADNGTMVFFDYPKKHQKM